MYVKILNKSDFAALLSKGYGARTLKNPWEYYDSMKKKYGDAACVDITPPNGTIRYAPESYYIEKGYIRYEIDQYNTTDGSNKSI